MMGNLENSERFKNEYRYFSEKISNIEDENLKKELNQKLLELLREVRYIDRQHQDIFNQKSVSAGVSESRSKLMEIRKFLDKKLKEIV